MPAVGFRCPDGATVKFGACTSCDHRCMSLPALKSAEDSTHHWFGRPSVTQLIQETRPVYLELTNDYYVDPMGSIAAMIGTSVHKIMEDHSPHGWLAEARFDDDITSGAVDAYDCKTQTLFDFKAFGAYHIASMLGMRPKWEKRIITRGKRKGQEEWAQKFIAGGVRNVHDVALQLNYYRILLEKHNLPVKKLMVNTFVRGGLDATAKKYGITQASYLIPINFISKHWTRMYFKAKYDRLMYALDKHEMPPVCSAKNRWDTSKSFPDRKCRLYCNAHEFCPYWIENYGE